TSRMKGAGARSDVRNSGQSGLEEWIGELLLIRDQDGELLPALCIGVHSKMRTLTCQTFRKKAVLKLPPSEVAESLGKWSGSVEQLEEAVPNVMRFVRPWLKNLHWEQIDPATEQSLNDICEAIGAE